jgi:hypothetical protein
MVVLPDTAIDIVADANVESTLGILENVNAVDLHCVGYAGGI